MTPERLLAKGGACNTNVLLAKKQSMPGEIRPEERLVGHTASVVRCAIAILDTLGEQSIITLGISRERWSEARKTLILAAYLHDFGKANSHFQRMIRNSAAQLPPQMIRHEILSGYMAWQIPALRLWLENIPDVNLPIAVWGAIGHHLKAYECDGGYFPSKYASRREQADPPWLKLYLAHPDFQNLLTYGCTLFPELPYPPLLEEVELNGEETELDDISEMLAGKFHDLSGALSQEDLKLLAWTKAMVIASDVVGSAVGFSRKDQPMASWEFIEKNLSCRLEKDELDRLIAHCLGDKEADPLKSDLSQRLERSSGRVSLVLAGCGTGKTMAAYHWARQHAIGKKLMFAYPTTGTATAGFKDYAAEVEDLNAILVHGRSEIDLEDMQVTFDEEDLEGIPESIRKIDALKAWPMKLQICTVDTILGIIANHRRGLFSFPLLLNTAFVFDEIHAYDPQLFGYLLRFLQMFSNAPILLMTASLPNHYLESLKQVTGEALEIIPGPGRLEDLPRYHLQKQASMEDAIEAVRLAVLRQQKILWVCNTIGESRRVFETLKDQSWREWNENEIPIFLYHSAFRYEDRVQRQRHVIQFFNIKENPGAVIVVSTQVCEMSLDISADLLISEKAPPSALIQRLGRLNRRTSVQNPCPSALAILLPLSDSGAKVYKEELALIDPFIESLPDENVSQTHLSEALTRVLCEQAIEPATQTEWLDYFWQTPAPGSIRQAGTNITVLLEDDKSRCRSGRDALALAVPIANRSHIVKRWPRHEKNHLPIAPTTYIQYSKETGAQWQ